LNHLQAELLSALQHGSNLLFSMAGLIVLLKAVHRGEFALNGFRNRDLQRLLYPEPKLFRSANGDGAPWR